MDTSSGKFTAGVAGIYFVTLETTIGLHEDEYVHGILQTSSGSYSEDGLFINCSNEEVHDKLWDQASASRQGQTQVIDVRLTSK